MTSKTASVLLSALSLWLVITPLSTKAMAEVGNVAGTARTSNETDVGYTRKFGLGFMVGDPTGLTAKLWLGPTNAIDFGLGLVPTLVDVGVEGALGARFYL